MINENQIVPYETSELPVADGPWLVFAPHADDESFGMGGALAKAVEKGIRVELVIMTDGALGGQSADLPDVRKKEALKAAALLGLEKPVFLDNKDRGLTLDENTIAQVAFEIQRVKPAAVFFPGVFELHPDHRATALIVWRAIRSLSGSGILPVPVAYEVLVQSPINTLIDITPYIEAKKSAMAVYESQLAESSYVDIALTMDKLRTLTIDPISSFAEGFYCFEFEDLESELVDVVKKIITSYLSE
jgi:N-acetylglucosamine malate deacetylase 1